MSDTNIQVAITAEVTDLRSKLALVQQDLKSTRAEFTATAKEMKAAGDGATDELKSKFQGLAEQTVKVEREQKNLQSSLRAATETIGGMHGSVSTATREFRALFDELSSGRTKQTPGTLAIIATRVLGISGGALAAAAPIAALAAGLAYMAYEAYEANKNLTALSAAATLTGRSAELSRDFFEHETAALERMSGVSKKTALEILGLEAAHGGLSASIINQINQVVPAFVTAYGEKAPESIKRLIEGLDDLDQNGLKRLDKEMLGLTPAQYEMIDGLIKIGDKASAAAEILRVMGERGGIGIKSLDQQIVALKAEMAEQQSLATMAVGFDDFGQAAGNATIKVSELKNAIAGLEQAKANEAKGEKDRNYKGDFQEAEAENRRLDERGTLLGNIARLTKDVAEAKARGDTTGEGTFNTALAGENKKLAEYDKRGSGNANAMQAFREALDKRLMDQQAFGEKAKQVELAYWQGVIETTKSGSAERAEIEHTIYELESQLASARISDERKVDEERKRADAEKKRAMADWLSAYNAGIRDQLTLAQGNYIQEIAIARGWLADMKAIYGENSKNASDAQNEVDKLGHGKDREDADNARLITGGQIDLAKGGAKPTLEKSTNIMSALFGIEDPSADLQTQMDSLKSTFQAEQADFTKQLSGAGDQKQFTEIFKKMEAAQRSYTQKVMALNTQAADHYKTAWENAFQPVNRAVSSSIEGIIRGTLRVDQGLRNLGQSIVLSLIDKSAQAATKWIADRLAELAFTNLTEAGKTGAVAAGEASRTGVKLAGAAEGKAIEAASGSASVMGDAHKAAAGAYAAVSQIPVIGPALAPAAAGAAFAAVTAFDLFSAEGGMDIPAGVNPMVQTHAQEMILPKPYANVIRGLADQGVGGGSAGNTFNHNLSQTNNITSAKGLTLDEMHTAFRNSHRDAKRSFAQTIAPHLR